MDMQALHPQDIAVVAELLAACGLPGGDLTPSHLHHFWGCREGDQLVGVVGLEVYDRVALLRSVAVAPSHRGRGLGAELVRRIEAYAGEQGVEVLFLLTTTAEAFFSGRGYRMVPREAPPPSIQHTNEFAALCPSQAVCMTKSLRDDALEDR